jgi:hypothetical protein
MAEMKPYEPRLFSDNIPHAVGDFARWLGASDHTANFYGNRAQEFFKMSPPGAMVDAASDIGRDLGQGRVGPALLNAAGAVLNTHAAGKILGGLLPVTRGLQDTMRAKALDSLIDSPIRSGMPPTTGVATGQSFDLPRTQPNVMMRPGMAPANVNDRSMMRPRLGLVE